MKKEFAKLLRLIFITTLMGSVSLGVLASSEYKYKSQEVEVDGFVWYSCTPKKGKFKEAVGVNGKTLIPMTEGYSSFGYKNGFLYGLDIKK